MSRMYSHTMAIYGTMEPCHRSSLECIIVDKIECLMFIDVCDYVHV